MARRNVSIFVLDALCPAPLLTSIFTYIMNTMELAILIDLYQVVTAEYIPSTKVGNVDFYRYAKHGAAEPNCGVTG